MNSVGQTTVAENGAWECVPGGWKQIYGPLLTRGVSFEWHDFESRDTFDWSRSFHKGSLEICLNLEGAGRIEDRRGSHEFLPGRIGAYITEQRPLSAERRAGERHRFITLELSRSYLEETIGADREALHPEVTAFIASKKASRSCFLPPRTLDSRMTGLGRQLLNPPMGGSAASLWFQGKALQLMAEVLYKPAGEGEFFCARQKRIAWERVDKAKAILGADLENPPLLRDLGRRVGCSPFYLSRTFSELMGMTIPRYVRQLRMERAAEMLRSGSLNVTEVAFAVGYNSLSHFSKAFSETFGHCPCLYPFKTKE